MFDNDYEPDAWLTCRDCKMRVPANEMDETLICESCGIEAEELIYEKLFGGSL